MCYKRQDYEKSDWNGINFSLIDTGGFVKGSDDIFEKEIVKQVEFVLMKLVLFYLLLM